MVSKTKKQTKIQRKPTKATNEEEVSEADRQLHQKIAAEVKAKLEAKGKSSEGVETFEAFYGMIKEEAVKLQTEYQPKLRDGIKIAVDLVNSVQQDEKDGDVDVKVRIAPNSNNNNINIDFENIGIDEVMQHVKQRDLTVSRKRGIGGCHDMNAFYNLRHEYEGYDIPMSKGVNSSDIPTIIIRSKKPHETIPGVYLVEYGIPALDKKQETSGEVKWIKDPKTVYDPQEWTDEKLKKALREAITDAASKNGGQIPSTNPTRGTTSSGHTIVYTYRDGKVTSFWFA